MSAEQSAAPAAAERQGEEPERSGLKRALWDFLHLAVLSAFALAQPLFDLLGKNPEFFAARGSPGGDIITFALVVVIVPPLVLLAVELLVGLASDRARRILHLVFVAVLFGLIVIQALKDAIGGSDVIVIGLSLAIGALVAVGYARTEGIKLFMSVLSPAPLVLLLLFLFASPVSKLAFPDDASAKAVGGVSRAPVVVVLLDELPVTSLMDDRKQVDPVRFPAFASLAKNATWYRNAYAIYDSTERAQPAIMDGNYPEEDKLPTSSDHPNSIFTLFGKTHRMNVSEEATSICPRDLCKDERLDETYGSRMSSMGGDLGLVWLHVVSPPGIEADLPSVSENWGNFGGGGEGEEEAGGENAPGDEPNTKANLNRNRNKRFDAWIADVRASQKPALNFKHTLLPHVPWQYLPSGRQYRRTARDPIPGISSETHRDPGQLESLYQRHLLQLGFADRELGKLFAKLRRTGQYDKSLIVVAADHGVAFDVGKRDRRKLNRGNAEQISPIPLFVKGPGERRGRIDDAYVETVDILPTIFDELGIRPKVKMDGRPASSERVQRRRTIRILERGTFKPLRFSAAEWERRKDAVIERKLRLFGVGRDGPERLYRIGPNQQLLGRPVSSLSVTNGSGASFTQAREYPRVDLRSPNVPAHVTGRLTGIPLGRDLAIAVNGRIRAVGRSFRTAKSPDVLFAAMVPETSFRQGRNRVEVFEVSGGTALRRLGAAG